MVAGLADLILAILVAMVLAVFQEAAQVVS
jgi:hypothetical protein